MTQKMPAKLYRKPSPAFPQMQYNASSSQSQSQFNPSFARPQLSPSFSFAQPQPSPAFSPLVPTAAPFQPMGVPSSPGYESQIISPPSPALYVDPTIPLHKQTPAPCNFYYLATCKDGMKCKFGHHYILTPEQLEDFRESAKQYPCPTRLRGQYCEFGDNCCMGHVCPRGQKCTFLKQGNCKYTKAEMHVAVPNTPRRRRRHKANKQSIDGSSEAAPSESSGISWV